MKENYTLILKGFIFSFILFLGSCGSSSKATEIEKNPKYVGINDYETRLSFAKLIMDKHPNHGYLPDLKTKKEMWAYTNQWKKVTFEYEDILKFRSYTGLQELKTEMTSINDTLRSFYCELANLCPLGDKNLFNLDSSYWMSEPQIIHYKDHTLGFCVVKQYVKKDSTDSLRYKPKFILYSSLFQEESWKGLLTVDFN